MRMLALYGAYDDYAACVQDAVAADSTFAGRLPERVVDAGLGAELQRLAARHLGTSVDDAAQPRGTRIANAGVTLQALAAYGASRNAPADEPMPAQMRRLVSVVETTGLTARALGLDCEPSETLVTLMEQAENDYF